MWIWLPASVAGPEMTSKLTARPDDADAATTKSPSPNVFDVSGAKVIVWSAVFTTSTSAADVLVAEVLSPSYDAVIECEPTERPLDEHEACPLSSSVAA